MKILAVIAGALTMALGHSAPAQDVHHLPTPPHAHHAAPVVHVPPVGRWVKCPGNPRILMACFTR